MIDENHPLLFFGGPYSNFQATSALRNISVEMAIPPSNVICTGDVVAYAAEPEQTVNLIRDWGIQVVAGNCETQLANGAEDCGCGFSPDTACDQLSRNWYTYALAHTSTDARAWMGQLPARLDIAYNGILLAVVHGGATENNRFLFGSEHRKLASEIAAVDRIGSCDIVVAGHAGLPFMQKVNSHLWLNAGVIGMPANDGTRDGWYAVVEATNSFEGVEIALRRFSYGASAAAASMRRVGYANAYADTLLSGIWPSHEVLPIAERNATGKPLQQSTTIYNKRLAA